MPDGDMTRSITTLGPRKTEPAMGLRVGHADDGLRRRHMVCPSAKAESWQCRGCDHLSVHDEILPCKSPAPCGGICKPVTEANE